MHGSSILFALHRVGPYHHVRLQAAAATHDIHVLETRPESLEYPWCFDAHGSYCIHQLSNQINPEADPPLSVLHHQLNTLLDTIEPQAIVSVGWSDRTYQVLLSLAQQRHIPVILISDSRHRDEQRSSAKEFIKRQLLRGYSAAIVAGQESRAYLLKLGFPPAAIAQPWDVVDNGFFAKIAAQAGTFSASQQPHFLCVSRLVAKKNHAALLQAFALYQSQGGIWGLKLVGSGPMEPAIRSQIDELPYPRRVQLLPFCQLEQLGDLYAQASTFVLASTTDQWGLVVNEAMAAGLPCLVSTSCGCAVDLIEHGISGWCFDPTNPLALASLMLQAERQLPSQRRAMQAAAQQRLKAFTPEAFAEGFHQALEWAITQPRFSRRAALTAALLCRRP